MGFLGRHAELIIGVAPVRFFFSVSLVAKSIKAVIPGCLHQVENGSMIAPNVPS